MGAPKGHKKYGGRVKGTPNKASIPLEQKALELGIDPFEILLRFAAEDWKGLGYDARTTISYSGAGIEFEEFIIKPELRGKCAAEAVQYLHAKRKSIDHHIDPQELEMLDKMRPKSIDELRAIVNGKKEVK